MKDIALLLDGNSLMFRAYYATAYTGNLMHTKDGIYTNALFGFVNMFTKLLDTFNPKYVLVAFDKGKKTFRHQALESYKGTRQHMPEELAMQIPLIKEYLDHMNIKRLELDEFEADDIVGSMAKIASDANLHAICVSGDKDLLQLTNDFIDVYLTRKGVSELEEYNILNFKEKMGFEVWQMVDYKALIGDKSDNLEGVKGIGEKTAIALLAKYGSIDGIYEHIEELTPKAKETFKLSKDVCYMTRYLAKIYQDINFDFSLDDLFVKSADIHNLRIFYQKLELNSFLKKLKDEPLETNNLEIAKPTAIKAINDGAILEELEHADEIYLSTEAAGDNYHKADCLGAAILINQKAYFIDNLYSDLFSDTINKINQLKIKVNTLDCKKDIVILKYHNLALDNIVFDLSLAVYLINPAWVSEDIKNTMGNIVPNNLPAFEDIYGKNTKFAIPHLETYSNYAMDKVIQLSLIKQEVMNQLQKIDVEELYQIELKLANVLADMEKAGFKIDKKRLVEIGEEFNQKIEDIKKEIYQLIGKEFNIASPKQLGVILFDELKLSKGKKNKTGYSTSAEVLESMKDLHPVVPLILEYRKYTKLYSTYVQGLFSEIASDGKVHTIFKQTLTSTGRLSSVEPNIQNIPIRTIEGKIIRSAFIPSRDGGKLISADYSQIELRILAQMANCEAMIKDFNEGIDLHASTAAKIFGVSLNDVTKDMRRQAKAVNFGIIYGMSDWGLADTLQIQTIDAKIFIDKYFSIYPEIKIYLDNLVNDAKKKGYTLTMFNRRRYIPEINSSNYSLRSFGERTSMNAPIQGSAADIIKLAMVKVFTKMQDLHLKSKMIAQVHDEIIIDATHDEIDIVKEILKKEMESVYPLKVKLTVDVEMGDTWDLK